MAVHIEFFGIPRQRAGVAKTTVQTGQLGDVLAELERRYPALAETCLQDGQLRPGYTANLGGDRFINDPSTELADGDVVLIFSADAGG
ncbi:MAG: MoaD/ThiS family protein [Pirellulales bacterium]|nr:MoaD/ThiS family protein [Pirellulales bacterium]